MFGAFVRMLIDCLFDSKEERNFMSPKFNTKKFIIFLVIVMESLIICLAMSRLNSVNTQFKHYKEQHESCAKNND